ncbi:hypothetical protein ACNF49_39455 [Actinomadura sp. ATCC 39365]
MAAALGGGPSMPRAGGDASSRHCANTSADTVRPEVVAVISATPGRSATYLPAASMVPGPAVTFQVTGAVGRPKNVTLK